MYSVFIADDEFRVINGLLKKIDWERLDAEIAGYAQNGHEAEQKILALKPDIVITDIMMPGMSGLQVIEAVRKQVPSVFIIFSGYSEFEYAKTAIRLEAVDYLIKPVNIKEIEDTIQKAQQRFDHQQLSSGLPLLKGKEQALVHILNGDEADTQLFAGTGAFFTVLIGFRGDTDNAVYTDILMAIEELSTDQHELFLIKNKKNVIIFCAVQSSVQVTDFRKMILRKIKVKARAYPDTFFWGLGCIISDINQIQISYASANDMLSFCQFICNQLEEDFKPVTSESMDYNTLLATTTNNILCAENSSEVEVTINKFINKMINERYSSARIRSMCLELYYNIRYQYTKEYKNIAESNIFKNSDTLMNMLGFNNVGEFKGIFIDLMKQMNDISESQKNNYKARLISTIRNYIKNNIDKNMTLNDIAESVNMNPAYVSYVFKHNTNKNLFDYITEVRMEKAQYLLKTTHLKIFEISSAVGYVDQRYFCQVFKKRVGMTAMEYRDSSGGEKESF